MSGYTLPDGVTLKNKLGAMDEDELAQLEVREVRARLLEIELGAGPTGQFDAEHLKAIHRHLFQNVYEWAGHTRNERVPLSDSAIATEPLLRKMEGQPFAVGPAIPATLDDISQRLKEANCLRNLTRDEFAERAADTMIELNGVHPFREGNGRTQRAFMRELAKEAGHSLDFSIISAERMIQASIAGHEQDDPSMMRRMFDEISDPVRAALLRESIAALGQFKWNDRYIATVTPGQTINLTFIGIAGEQFMGHENSRILFGKRQDLPQPHPKRGDTFTVTTPLRPREQSNTQANADQPLSPDQVLSRFGNPEHEARYFRQEQQREKTASPSPAAPDRVATRGDVPVEKQAEQRRPYNKFIRDSTGGKVVRDIDEDHNRDKDKDRDGPTRGGGGRSRR